jgi:hypothetical protein
MVNVSKPGDEYTAVAENAHKMVLEDPNRYDPKEDPFVKQRNVKDLESELAFLVKG